MKAQNPNHWATRELPVHVKTATKLNSVSLVLDPLKQLLIESIGLEKPLNVCRLKSNMRCVFWDLYSCLPLGPVLELQDWIMTINKLIESVGTHIVPGSIETV